MNSRSYFSSALAPDFLALIEAGNPALALEWLMDFARRPAFAPAAGLADHCAALAPFVAAQGDTCLGLDRPTTLYLGTDLSTLVGFGDFLSALVQSRPTERHIVLLTGVADAEHAAAHAQLRKTGAFALCPPPGVTNYDRLLWLCAKLNAIVAQRVILLHHPQDVLAAMGMAQLAEHSGRRLYRPASMGAAASTPARAGVKRAGVKRAGAALIETAWTGVTQLPGRVADIQRAIEAAELPAAPFPDLLSAQSIGAGFDAGFYRRANPELAAIGSDPLAHYIGVGRAEGRKPHPLFEPDYYLSQLPPDMADLARDAPLAHYLHVGEHLGYPPYPLFNPAWCRAMLAAQGLWPKARDGQISVLARYCAVGGLVSPHPLFDPAHYARQMPLPIEGADLLIHFMDQGLPEGLDPHPLIDIRRLDGGRKAFRASFLRYISQYQPSADEPSAHVLFDPRHFAAGDADRYASLAPNLLWAHLIEGNLSARPPHPLISVEHVARNLACVHTMAGTVLEGVVRGTLTVDTHPLINGAHIRAQGAWLGGATLHPTAHYMREGGTGHTDPHPCFSSGFYLASNPAVATSGQPPLLHYLLQGEAAGCLPHPFFSPAHYATVIPPTVRAGQRLVHYLERGTRHFTAVQHLDGVYGALLNKAARRSFEAGGTSLKGSAAYLKEALHSEWAPPHPTLITETRALDLSGAEGVCLHPAQSVRVGRPSIMSQTHISVTSGRYDAPAATVAVYPEARVVGGNDGFITQDGRWCDHGLLGFNPDNMAVKHGGAVAAANGETVLIRRFDSPATIGQAIFGCGSYAENYFHFLFETLPRALLAAEIAPPGTPVLVNDAMPAQHYQALRLMLPGNPPIRLAGHVTCAVRRLYATSMPSLVHDAFGDAVPPTDAVRYHPAVLARLARFAAPFRTEGPRKKLFLRRVGAIRNLLNIDDLERQLIDLGFETVSCETLDFASQVRLFANAEAIVAPTGAHLANMVFAPAATRILPLYSNAPGGNFYLWSVLGDLLKQDVVNVAGWRVAGSCAGRAPEAHEDYTVPPVLVLPLFQDTGTAGQAGPAPEAAPIPVAEGAPAQTAAAKSIPVIEPAPDMASDLLSNAAAAAPEPAPEPSPRPASFDPVVIPRVGRGGGLFLLRRRLCDLQRRCDQTARAVARRSPAPVRAVLIRTRHLFRSLTGTGPQATPQPFPRPPAILPGLVVKPSPERAPVHFQTALAALDRLVGAVSEALALSGSWGLLAGPTPSGFENRLGAIRRDLSGALEHLKEPELEQIARHAFFAHPSYAQISGLVLLQGTTGADIRATTGLTDRFDQWSHEPATTPQGREDRLRQMLVMMLYRQPWQVPLVRDLADLPAEGRAAYLAWLNQSPILCRAGDEAAYAGFVLRYMDWLESHLSADRPLAQVILVGQTIGSLDLGKLLLIDQPLRAVQDRRNRLLARLALREGRARGRVRATDGSEGRIRIGVLCRTFDKGPDSEAVVAFFRAFDPARYDIRAYSIGLRDRVGGQDEAFERLFHAAIHQATVLKADASHIRRQLISDDLDVFLFANATTYGLRDLDKALFHRVAPVQAVLNSHLPMPLGYPSFDAFITGKTGTPDLGTPDLDVPQDDYCETLIRRPGPVINYLSSLQPRADKGLTRAAFGLAQDDVVAMTAGSLAKLGHECLSTMMRAVKDIPRGRLLIAPYNPGWAGLSLAIPFNRQIAETAAEVGLAPDRITVLGEMTVAETEAALGMADIYLNPFPHGGATMMHLALVYGKPAVTLRRRSTRSIDQFLLSALGFDDLLAQTPQDYVTLTRKLGQNTRLRQGVVRRLAAADLSVLVGNMDYSRDMQATLEQLIAQTRDRKPPR